MPNVSLATCITLDVLANASWPQLFISATGIIVAHDSQSSKKMERNNSHRTVRREPGKELTLMNVVGIGFTIIIIICGVE
jgi:hypothetical protein